MCAVSADADRAGRAGQWAGAAAAALTTLDDAEARAPADRQVRPFFLITNHHNMTLFGLDCQTSTD